jgi:hypothetical protein
MGKKREQMSDEEYAERLARLAEIRVKALAKRAELAAPKREAKEAIKKQNQAILEKRNKLLEAKQKEAAQIDKEIESPTLPEYQPPPPETPRVMPRVVSAPHDIPWAPTKGRNGLEDFFYYEQLRQQIKDKYKQKYKPTPTPLREEPVINPVAETAKETLKSKIDDEVRKLAYQSLFGRPM